jgi:hypothetical protein
MQQLSGAEPVVQLASLGIGVFTVNVRSVVQNGFMFAGICSAGVKGGVGGTKGAVNNSVGGGNPGGGGVGVTAQGMVPLGTAGQVVVTESANVTLGPSGSGPHTVSRLGRGRNLLQSSAVRKLKT